VALQNKKLNTTRRVVYENSFKCRTNQKNLRNVLAGAGEDSKRKKEANPKAVYQMNH
jgi:hypothetical protein